ncbi:alpha/beta hydrolase [Polymorphospora rubra]|uniref:alpha/beta fold hydrolase n=1 Tax=Polymorphospora rubra TaxID=338584 RepID=UPI0033CDFE35
MGSTGVGYRSGSVVSADGTVIGYRRLGAGPGVVLMHGSMMTAQNFTRLGAALAGDFTVYLPDRRGRGTSGPYGPDFTLRHAAEDVGALMAQTGSRNVFGLSAGAIPILRWAVERPAGYRIALYEPPLPVNGSAPAAWLPRYERELARGASARALVTVMKGTRDSRIVDVLPRAVLVPLLGLAMRAQARRATGADVPLRDLVPTMRHDARLVLDAVDLVEASAAVRSEVLLVGGGRSAAYLRDALDALEATVPGARRVELPGVGHLAPDDGGRPERVARVLVDFFGDG